MSLIANALKQSQGRRVHWEPQRQCAARPVNLLAFLGKADDEKIVQTYSRHAAESWPFPPSTMIKSGNRTATKLSSFRAERSGVEESRRSTCAFCNGLPRLRSG